MLPPDSGHWTLNEQSHLWEESISEDEIPTQQSIDCINLKQGGEDTQYRLLGDTSICVDGFPRQGNRYIRHQVLSGLPDIAIPYRLMHKQALIEIAAAECDHVFLTIREPLDAISSYISMMLRQHHKYTIVFDHLNKVMYSENDYEYVKKCFAFYERLTVLPRNLSNCTIVPFSTTKSASADELLERISYVIKVPYKSTNRQKYGKGSSTHDAEIRDYLSSPKFAELLASAERCYELTISSCASV